MKKDEIVERIKDILIDALEQDQSAMLTALGSLTGSVDGSDNNGEWAAELATSNGRDVSNALVEVANTLRGGDELKLTLGESVLLETHLQAGVTKAAETSGATAAEMAERLSVVIKKLQKAREKKS